MLKFEVFSFEGSELLLAFVEIVEVFSYKEASEDFLYDGGLMGEITKIFLVKVFKLLFFELFSGIVCSELGLYFDGGGFFAFELFSLEIHFEFGLYFECGLVVAFPIFLSLIGAVVVKLDGVLEAGFKVVGKVHAEEVSISYILFD
jgi:hypothetical protein